MAQASRMWSKDSKRPAAWPIAPAKLPRAQYRLHSCPNNYVKDKTSVSMVHRAKGAPQLSYIKTKIKKYARVQTITKSSLKNICHAKSDYFDTEKERPPPWHPNQT